jgi:hypothetical protein
MTDLVHCDIFIALHPHHTVEIPSMQQPKDEQEIGWLIMRQAAMSAAFDRVEQAIAEISRGE